MIIAINYKINHAHKNEIHEDSHKDPENNILHMKRCNIALVCENKSVRMSRK